MNNAENNRMDPVSCLRIKQPFISQSMWLVQFVQLPQHLIDNVCLIVFFVHIGEVCLPKTWVSHQSCVLYIQWMFGTYFFFLWFFWRAHTHPKFRSHSYWSGEREKRLLMASSLQYNNINIFGTSTDTCTYMQSKLVLIIIHDCNHGFVWYRSNKSSHSLSLSLSCQMYPTILPLLQTMFLFPSPCIHTEYFLHNGLIDIPHTKIK